MKRENAPPPSAESPSDAALLAPPQASPHLSSFSSPRRRGRASCSAARHPGPHHRRQHSPYPSTELAPVVSSASDEETSTRPMPGAQFLVVSFAREEHPPPSFTCHKSWALHPLHWSLWSFWTQGLADVSLHAKRRAKNQSPS